MCSMNISYTSLLPHVVTLAKQAGAAILQYYHQEQAVAVRLKKDDSPVTDADMAAHQLIAVGLKQLTPELPILSEEAADIPYSTRSTWQQYWLIDPLDGTKEFIQGHAEFTVNIALIVNNKPVLGVVYLPVLGTCYFAAENQGTFRQQDDLPVQSIQVRSLPQTNVMVAISRRRTTDQLLQFLAHLDQYNYSLIKKGSSIKSCLVAEGTADVYPSFGLTSEWDTAAAQCVVEEAGGSLVDLQLQPLRYNTKESLLNPYFIVLGDVSYDWGKYL
ncbi:3'(2'),5'-bisphosphate nucleotidase CysQ [soil metagenome]